MAVPNDMMSHGMMGLERKSITKVWARDSTKIMRDEAGMAMRVFAVMPRSTRYRQKLNAIFRMAFVELIFAIFPVTYSKRRYDMMGMVTKPMAPINIRRYITYVCVNIFAILSLRPFIRSPCHTSIARILAIVYTMRLKFG